MCVFFNPWDLKVHYAANYHTPSYGTDNHRLDHTEIVRGQIDFVRSPFKPENIRVYRQLKMLMEENHFQLVHCHTPMGGVMARLAAHATKTEPVVYTAHGFHFFKGAPVINWLLDYPMERFLSRFTTQQICINQEDYERAAKKFHARYVDYIPGAGIDLSRFYPKTAAEIAEKKRELGLCEKKMILLSSGELIHRKNHETIIRAVAPPERKFSGFSISNLRPWRTGRPASRTGKGTEGGGKGAFSGIPGRYAGHLRHCLYFSLSVLPGRPAHGSFVCLWPAMPCERA